jgi:hypothetical protein
MELCHQIYDITDDKLKSERHAIQDSGIISLYEQTELIMSWGDFWAVNTEFGSLARCFSILHFTYDIQYLFD